VPLHGFISATDKWQVVEVKSDRTGAWLTARLDFYKEPAWMKQFPFAHTIEMTHKLSEGALEVRVTLKNMSSEPMPVSIGFHSWFKLTDSPREEWTLSMPAKSRWLLTDQKVPTGTIEPTDAFFVNGQAALKDYDLDDLFSDLTRDANGRATITLKGRTQQLDVVYGPKYPASVLFSPNPARTGRGSNSPAGGGRGRGAGAPGAPGGAAPPAGAGGIANAPATPGQAPAGQGAGAAAARAGGPGRGPGNSNFIAIEPMAAISNGMNLAQKGVYKDLQSIAPGGTWTESFWVRPRGF
jgi:aldose 1-epimerase